MPVTPALIDSWLDMHRQACSSQEACARELPRQGPLWIYGAGRFGRELASGLQQQGLSVAGFIDQRAQGPVNGLPCIPPAQDSWHGHCVLLGIHNPGADLTPVLALLRPHARDVLTPPQWIAACPSLSHFWLAPASRHAPTAQDLAGAVAACADAESIEVMTELLAWRWLGQPMTRHAAHPDPYQPADVPYLHGRVRMIDAGAYTGDTWASFRPRLDAYLGLEPDPHNHRQLLETLLDAGAQGAAALPLAAWHQREILRFTSDDAAGHVTADGFPVQAMPLDDWQAWRPTLIKMDIEGAEPEALQGARALLAGGCALAISAYHHPTHLWTLPPLMQALAGEALAHRRVWLRCHSHNGFDAVYYVEQCDGQRQTPH